MLRTRRKKKYRPTLRFSPYAWAKLLFLRDQGPTEIGGFGIAREGDPLLIEDVVLVRQFCTAVTVKFEDPAVADFFDEQIDLGRKPEQFARVWIHTHPGDSSLPSLTDERTFSRVFGRCDWAAMFILAKGGETFARLRFNLGPRSDIALETEIDWSAPFAGSSPVEWQEDYLSCVRVQEPFRDKLVEPGAEKSDDSSRELVQSETVSELDLWNAAFW